MVIKFIGKNLIKYVVGLTGLLLLAYVIGLLVNATSWQCDTGSFWGSSCTPWIFGSVYIIGVIIVAVFCWTTLRGAVQIMKNNSQQALFIDSLGVDIFYWGVAFYLPIGIALTQRYWYIHISLIVFVLLMGYEYWFKVRSTLFRSILFATPVVAILLALIFIK